MADETLPEPVAGLAAAPEQDTEAVPSIAKIQGLLRSKDDTSRFVGLALLKSVLDNSPDLQKDDGVIQGLWDSISPKFLARLLKSGSQPGSEGSQSRDMLDLAVAVLHTFAVLLPEAARRDDKLLQRIPALASAVLYSSTQTTGVILETLLSLVSMPEGAAIFAQLDVEEYSPLLEIAPENHHVMHILQWTWQQGPTLVQDLQARAKIAQKIGQGLQALISAFHGTDATSLLEFLPFLSSLDPDLIPPDPPWLEAVVKLIRNLCTNRPSAQGRSAYTNCAGTLLLMYPQTMPSLLFRGEASNSSKPFSFLFISLIMVDIRATLPSLLEQLNDTTFPQTSRRLSSAMDILTAFIGHLIAYMERLDDPSDSGPTTTTEAFNLEPDLMIKLSKSIAETVSLTMEFLRDRWDASVAGAQGLHVEARSGQAHTGSGSHKTLAWDSKGENASTDPLTLSAIRSIALWLRDDDGDTLREQAAGLVDMLLELYQSSTSSPTKSNPQGLDYRLPALTALEGILRTSNGVEAFNVENGWQVLTKDLLAILSSASDPTSISPMDVVRGTRIVFVLDLVMETERSTHEIWMDVVTGVAAFSMPDDPARLQDQAMLDLLVDVVWLAANLLQGASAGMRSRYVHSVSAIRGIARQIEDALVPGSKAASELKEAHATLGSM